MLTLTVDIRGKFALITGCDSGFGRETDLVGQDGCLRIGDMFNKTRRGELKVCDEQTTSDFSAGCYKRAAG